MVVAVFVCYSTDILPQDVGHGRGEETVLDVEGVQVVVGLLEDAA